MAFLKTILCVRLACLLITGAMTIVVVGLSGKALSDLHHDRQTATQLVKGTIHANDVLGSLGAVCGTAGFGTLVAFYSEFSLYREKRHKVSTGMRLFNELLLAFAFIALLGSAIAGTVIILHRSATITSPIVSSSVIIQLLHQLGRSLAYKDSKAYPAVICSWICVVFLLFDLILVIAAGLHYRKEAREARSSDVAEMREKTEDKSVA